MAFPKRLAAFWALGLLLLAAIAYSRAVRRTYSLESLQYMPKESELTVVSGPIDVLWSAVDHHFGDQIRNDEESALYEYFSQIRETLDEQGTPIVSLDDLEGYGLNVRREVLYSVPRLDESPVVMFRVTDAGAVISFFSSTTEEAMAADAELARRLVSTGARPPRVFPLEDGLGLILDDPHDVGLVAGIEEPLNLRRALTSGSGNRSYAMELDSLFEGVRDRLGGPLASGPALFGLWRPRGLPPLDEAVAALTFRRDQIVLEADLRMARSLRVADDLVSPSSRLTPWADRLPADTAAVVVADDSALTDYLRFLAMSPEIRRGMEEIFGGVLAELQTLEKLERILLAVTGYRDGLPELTMGIWSDTDSLSQLVGGLQVRHRVARDRGILERALLEYATTTNDNADPGLRDLEGAGLITAEPGALFGRFPISEGVVGDPGLTPADLELESYRETVLGREVLYVLPPITENDLRFVEEYQDQDRDLLMSDRYRIATGLVDDTLWVSADSKELEKVLELRSDGEDNLTHNPLFAAVESQWTGGEKLNAFVNVDQSATLGLFSPESEIEASVKNVFGVLRDHPAISVTLTPVESRDVLALSVRLLHRSGLANP